MHLGCKLDVFGLFNKLFTFIKIINTDEGEAKTNRKNQKLFRFLFWNHVLQSFDKEQRGGRFAILMTFSPSN